MRRAASLARALCGVDPRALAALRIGLALVVLADVSMRAPDVTAFLSDAGLLTRAQAAASAGPWRFSPFFWSGSAGVQAAWLALTAAAAVALLAGVRTRLATIAVWLLVASMQLRNQQILAGGDLVLRCCLFWSIFLPLGAVFSRDATGKAAPRVVGGVPAFALLAQVAVVYVASGFAKSGDAWTQDHSAIWHALQLQQLRTAPGAWLSGFPGLLAGSTAAVLWLERLGPLLALLPALIAAPLSMRWMRRLASAGRIALAGAFIAFHLAIALTMRLGIFPWVCCVAWLPFLPAAVWRRLPIRRAPSAPSRLQWARDAALLSLLFYTLTWNLAGLRFGRASEWARASYSTAEAGVLRATALDQNWGMFAPNPLRESQTLRAEGETEAGERIPVEAPAPGERWRKYWMNLATQPFTGWRATYAQWMLARWNEAHPGRRLRSVEVILQRETRELDGTVAARSEVLAGARR